MKFLKALFFPPVFEDDEEKTRVASQINAILWVAILLLGFLLLGRFLSGSTISTEANLVILVLFGALLIILALVKLRFIRIASLLFIFFTWGIMMYRAGTASGIRDSAFIAALIPILLAGLFLDYRYSIGLIVMTIGISWWFVSLETSGAITPDYSNPVGQTQELNVIFALIGFFSVLTIRGLNSSIQRSKNNALELIRANADLRNLREELEKRVEDRTSELELVSLQTQTRASQLAAIAEVAKSIAAAQEIDKLFDSITSSITEQFGYYHTGIFLLDPNREYAILSASNSEGGKKMLERGHRLRVGAQGLVGYVALTNQPRIALDTGADAIFFNNPDLPLTHSELAVPLQVANTTIGVLDVQSEQPNAFTEEDVAIVSTLANQIAIAIENARLFDETRTALKEAQSAYSKFVQSGWTQMQAQLDNIGYQYAMGKIGPLPAPLNDEYIDQAFATGAVTEYEGQQRQMAIPVKLRDEVIGVIKINIHKKDGRISKEDIGIIQTISERMALALENARLINDSQRRAARERALAQSTARIGSSVEYQTIMLSAVEELNHLLGDSEIIFQLKK